MNKAKDTKKPAKKNVQVAVRLRPMNDTERAEHGRTAMNCDTITKMISASNGKAFGPFDKCYAAESTQQEIYMDLVSPLIREVLEGYNCTVFAYGQTGTGKTFTMEGTHDESEDYSWDADPKAGIIPRALHHIFSELTGVEDFCVRVSYVELYNEELYDLLGSDSPDIEQQRLRIYDDKAHGNGVLINNLTEMTVRNRNEVYALLKKGAERRRTAATLMNMNSSRSHSVFTVSVMFRDNSVKSEELFLKTGKLNLVDLAGSENIGRSGSTASRAREAGNINQSLLTLGRVITALTSNAGHIPYRESKLTRILQDSLGGKTITTIIATLSPSSTSLEESISTLEYAQRAKNIKNSPEINAQVTRKALLREYSDEIERLRRDLIAARQKNGVFLAQENYDEMQEQIKENNARIEDLENQLQATMTKFQQIVEDFEFMDEQYCLAYEKHLEALNKLNQRMDELRVEREEKHRSIKKYEAAKFALKNSENEAKRLFAQAQQVNEFNIILGNELELLHEKHLECKRIFENNSKLLGNFSAHQIGTGHKMKDDVKMFGEKSNSTIKESKEHIDVLRDFSTEKLRILMLETSNINVAMTKLSDELKKFLLEHDNGTKEDVSKCNQINTNFVNKQLSGLTNIQTMNNNLNFAMKKFYDEFSQLLQKQEESTRNFEHAEIDQFNERKSKIDDYKSQMLKMFAEWEEQNQRSKQVVEVLVKEQRKVAEEIIQVKNKAIEEIKNIPEQITTNVENLSNSTNEFAGQMSQFAASVCEKSGHLNTFGGDTCDKVKDEIESFSHVVSGNIQECENNIEATSLTISTVLRNHHDDDMKLVTEMNEHLENTQQSMERFVHQEFHHYRSNGTPVKKKRTFGVEIVEPPSANQLYSEAESKMSPVKQIVVRESILASDSHRLLSPQTIKAQLAAKKMPILSSSSDENMQVE